MNGPVPRIVVLCMVICGMNTLNILLLVLVYVHQISNPASFLSSKRYEAPFTIRQLVGTFWAGAIHTQRLWITAVSRCVRHKLSVRRWKLDTPNQRCEMSGALAGVYSRVVAATSIYIFRVVMEFLFPFS